MGEGGAPPAITGQGRGKSERGTHSVRTLDPPTHLRPRPVAPGNPTHALPDGSHARGPRESERRSAPAQLPRSCPSPCVRVGSLRAIPHVAWPARRHRGGFSSPRVSPPSVRPRQRVAGMVGPEPHHHGRCHRTLVAGAHSGAGVARVLPGPPLLLVCQSSLCAGREGCLARPLPEAQPPASLAPSPARRRPAVGPSHIRWPVVVRRGTRGCRKAFGATRSGLLLRSFPHWGEGALPLGKILLPVEWPLARQRNSKGWASRHSRSRLKANVCA